MRLSRLAAASAACVLTFTACGGDGSDPKSDKDRPSSPSASPAGETANDKAGKRKNGKGDNGKGNLQGKAGVCFEIGAKAVGEVLDAPVVRRDSGTGEDCIFSDPNDPSGPSVGIVQTSLDAVGGADAVLDGLTGRFPDYEEVPEVGDQAVVAAADGPDGSAVVGAVIVDDSLVQVQPSFDGDLDVREGKERTIELLELVAGVL